MGYILGISCGYHDSAATLIKDGIVLGACEEERFTGIKHDSSFPHNTIKWLLQEYSITKDDLNDICFYEIPFEKIDRIETSTKKGGLLNYFNRRNIIKRNKESYIDLIQDINLYVGKETNVSFTEHHLSHAAYSYYTSPYNDAIIVSVDGVGEWETTTIYEGKRNTLTKLESIKFPHSLGMFYSTMTAFLGFKPNEGEYKMMGLAPYGDSSKYIDKFDSIITNHLGSFKLNMDFIRKKIDNQDVNFYINFIVSALFEANKYFNDQEPWKKKDDIVRLNTIVYTTLEIVRKISFLLYPIIPESSLKALKIFNIKENEIKLETLTKNEFLNEGDNINKIDILFKKIDKNND